MIAWRENSEYLYWRMFSLDAELMEYELRREGMDFISKRVETEYDFTRELEDLNPDVTLVESSLSSF